MNYFFDSYAVIELLKENPAYEKYADEKIVITIFNLTEIYWYSLNEEGEESAEEIYSAFRDEVVELEDEVLKDAMKFRKTNKKKNLSYADCIGYTYALKNNLLFLTGDKEFEGLKNVEFVK